MGTWQIRLVEAITAKTRAAVETPPLAISAYHVPKLRLQSPSYAFVGATVPVTAEFTHDEAIIADHDRLIEWSVDEGQSWTPGRSVYPLTATEGPVVKRCACGPRFLDAPPPEIDRRTTIERDTVTTFKPVRPIAIGLTGPVRVEVGETYTFNARLRVPYPGMTTPLTGRFTMPDGTTRQRHPGVVYGAFGRSRYPRRTDVGELQRLGTGLSSRVRKKPPRSKPVPGNTSGRISRSPNARPIPMPPPP